MLSLQGKLLQVLELEEVRTRDGKVIPPRTQVQIQTAEPLEDGQVRYAIQTIGVPSRRVVPGVVGEEVSLPVRAYTTGGDVRFAYAAAAA